MVGRKNHFGSRSLRGTQVAALFYTLCETARLVDVDPHTYLLRAVDVAITTPGAGSAPPPTHRLSSALAQRIARVTTG